jgi:hypothetical protein
MTTPLEDQTATTIEHRTERLLEDAELDAVMGGWGLIIWGSGTSSSGHRQHGDITITKNIDSHTPMLF